MLLGCLLDTAVIVGAYVCLVLVYLSSLSCLSACLPVCIPQADRLLHPHSCPLVARIPRSPSPLQPNPARANDTDHSATFANRFSPRRNPSRKPQAQAESETAAITTAAAADNDDDNNEDNDASKTLRR